jgi:hypothetical protein
MHYLEVRTFVSSRLKNEALRTKTEGQGCQSGYLWPHGRQIMPDISWMVNTSKLCTPRKEITLITFQVCSWFRVKQNSTTATEPNGRVDSYYKTEDPVLKVILYLLWLLFSLLFTVFIILFVFLNARDFEKAPQRKLNKRINFTIVVLGDMFFVWGGVDINVITDPTN